MTPSRLTKMLGRRVMVFWRDQPTRYDIEALQANIDRVGLVIRVRWALVAALALFSVFAAWAYSIEIPWADLWANMRIPAVALGFVLAYNAFYQRTYRRLGNIAILNHAQLMFDVVVVSVLVYYSGGVHSWFWAMYSLFVLEAAFILRQRWHTWLIAGFAALALGVVVWGEFLGVLQHIDMPFVSDALHDNLTFVSVRFMWQLTVLAGTATVASLMTGAIKRHEAEIAEASIVDEKTGLYDRGFFLRALRRELVRAEREDRTLGLVLLDIDDFERFNRLFGIDRGDRLLGSAAAAMRTAVAECSGGAVRDTNVVSRFGGEEFAILLVEGCTDGAVSRTEVEGTAERLRRSVSEARVEDAGVTVSVGVAMYPDDGMTADDLMDAADEALNVAAARGGNAVASATSVR